MRDPKTENWLAAGRYAFSLVENLPLDLIDVDEANPARMRERFDEKRIESIALAMIDGTPMPAVVVFDGSPHKHLLATGLHRIKAAEKAEKTALDAYVVVEPDDYRRAVLLRGINTIEGRAPTNEEVLRHVQEIIADYPTANVEALAEAFRVKLDTVRTYLRVHAVDARAEELGILDLLVTSGPFTGSAANQKAASQKLKLELGGIKNDDIFKRAAKTIVDTQLRGRVAVDLLREVKTARTDAHRYKLLDQAEQEYAEAQERTRALGSRRKVDTPTKMMRIVSAVAKKAVDYGHSVAKLELSALEPTQLARDIEIVRSARKWLDKIETEMLRLKGQHEKAHAVRIATGVESSESISASM